MRLAAEKGLIVDEFAGGGGASLGISRAIGREVDLAVNHDAGAVEMHSINHPRTRHLCQDVFKVDPVEVCMGRAVWFAWFSPDCRHFSRAKGSKPVSRRVRGLAHIACIWAKRKRPSVIFLENVREFQDWGPLIPKLDDAGRPLVDVNGNPVLVPDPSRKGQSFRRFVARFETLGYKVEWRDLDAADFGAPTHRRRLFLIARCDGQPIVWPARTHAPAEKVKELGLLPYRSAAECIDWSIPCPSIFEPRPGNKKPLVRNTMRRIAHGFMRYVKDCAKPYIVQSAHGTGIGYRVQGIDEPLRTITKSRQHAVVTPYLARIGQTGSNSKRVNDVRDPLTTVCSKNEHMLVAPYLVHQHGKSVGRDLREPSPAALQSNHHMLIAPWIAKHYGGAIGADVKRPLPTTTRRGTQNQLAAAYMVHLNREDKGSDIRKPVRTVVGGGCHAAEVRAFLVKYYGAEKDGQSLWEPLGTVTTNDRFGLVTVTIDGELYVVVDIGMRMLTSRELARAQGFPDSYVLTGNTENQVARIGNSVCPIMAEVIVRANMMTAAVRKERAA